MINSDKQYEYFPNIKEEPGYSTEYDRLVQYLFEETSQKVNSLFLEENLSCKKKNK